MRWNLLPAPHILITAAVKYERIARGKSSAAVRAQPRAPEARLRSIGAAHAPSRLAGGRFMERQVDRPGRVDHAHHHARFRNRGWPRLWLYAGDFPSGS